MGSRMEAGMNNKCPFCSDRICEIWIEYQIALFEVEEATQLCEENWKEIQRLTKRNEMLEKLLNASGIGIPPEA